MKMSSAARLMSAATIAFGISTLPASATEAGMPHGQHETGPMPPMDMSDHMKSPMMSDGHGAPRTGFGHPADPAVPAREVGITMGDMSFAPAMVEVKAGEAIRFVIHNASGVDHDFTLGDDATQQAHRKEMAETDGASGAHHHGDANAVMVAAGQNATLSWVFDQPGTVAFDCNIPGHFEAGMAGTVTVIR